MRRRLHGRTAQVDRRTAGFQRHERTKGTGAGVVQAQGHPPRVRVRPARRVRRRAGRGRRHDECGRDRGDALTPAGQPQAVGGRRADRDRGAARRRQGRLGLGPARPDPRHGCRSPGRRRCRSRSRRRAPAGGLSRAGRPRWRRPTPGGRCRSSEPRSPSPAADSRASQAGVRGHVAVGVTGAARRLVREGAARPAHGAGPPRARCTSTPTPTRGRPAVIARPSRGRRRPRPAAGPAGGSP